MTARADRPWRIERFQGGVAEAHHEDLTAAGAEALVRVVEVSRRTLVLGSGQDDTAIDAEAVARRGVDVVRRRSGGGAVLLAPGEVVWVDVVVPGDHPLWVPDVARAFDWLGETWVRALGSLGVRGATRHRGRMQRGPWSGLVCFAGLGPGEVTVDGRKVIGISQRRSRHAARFQVAVLLEFRARDTLELLALDAPARCRAERHLTGAVAALGRGHDEVVAAFLGALPAPRSSG